MGFANFKPTVWSKYIQRELDKKLILADFCNKKFQGEAEYGSRVKILGVANPTIGNYAGTTIGTPEIVNDTSVYLDINQSKYFNIGVDDVDKAQSIPGLMESLMKGATYGMKKAIDDYIASLAVNAGTLSSSTQINTAALAKTAVDAGMLKLMENDVAAEDIMIELCPFVYQWFLDKYITLDTNNREALDKGIMGYYNGAKVRMTNNLYNDGTDTYCMIRTKEAIAFVHQINKVEAFRPETLFMDAVKGLSEFGAKVVRPKELYAIRAHK